MIVRDTPSKKEEIVDHNFLNLIVNFFSCSYHEFRGDVFDITIENAWGRHVILKEKTSYIGIRSKYDD